MESKHNRFFQVFQQMFREDNGLFPDEITFKILVDGYGRVRGRLTVYYCTIEVMLLQVDPPDWAKISRLLNLMELTYVLTPPLPAMTHIYILGMK